MLQIIITRGTINQAYTAFENEIPSLLSQKIPMSTADANSVLSQGRANVVIKERDYLVLGNWHESPSSDDRWFEVGVYPA